MTTPKPRRLFRIRFLDRDEKRPIEVIVSHVGPSDFFGLVALSGFIFSDNKKLVILPDEDQVRKRFSKTEKLHIPYHNLVYVEEFDETPVDLKNLPFLKDVSSSPEDNPALS